MNGAVESSRAVALEGSAVDIARSLVETDDSPLVRARAASLLGEAARGGGGGDPSAVDGDALAVLARSAARDESPVVRVAAATALADALTCDESAAASFALAPGGIAELAEAMHIGNGDATAGEPATRAAALLLVRGGSNAVAFALSESNLFAALAEVLNTRADVAGLTDAYAKLGDDGGVYQPTLSPVTWESDYALSALAALRALVVSDEGKVAAVVVGVAAPLCAHLIHPNAAVRCAAAGVLAAVTLHIPAALACLGDGRALPLVMLPQLSVAGVSGATFRAATQTLCMLPAVRAAFFATAAGADEGTWMRSLVAVLPCADSARDLVAMARSPFAGDRERGAAREGIKVLEERETGVAALDDVAGSETVRG